MQFNSTGRSTRQNTQRQLRNNLSFLEKFKDRIAVVDRNGTYSRDDGEEGPYSPVSSDVSKKRKKVVNTLSSHYVVDTGSQRSGYGDHESSVFSEDREMMKHMKQFVATNRTESDFGSNISSITSHMVRQREQNKSPIYDGPAPSHPGSNRITIKAFKNIKDQLSNASPPDDHHIPFQNEDDEFGEIISNRNRKDMNRMEPRGLKSVPVRKRIEPKKKKSTKRPPPNRKNQSQGSRKRNDFGKNNRGVRSRQKRNSYKDSPELYPPSPEEEEEEIVATRNRPPREVSNRRRTNSYIEDDDFDDEESDDFSEDDSIGGSVSDEEYNSRRNRGRGRQQRQQQQPVVKRRGGGIPRGRRYTEGASQQRRRQSGGNPSSNRRNSYRDQFDESSSSSDEDDDFPKQFQHNRRNNRKGNQFRKQSGFNNQKRNNNNNNNSRRRKGGGGRGRGRGRGSNIQQQRTVREEPPPPRHGSRRSGPPKKKNERKKKKKVYHSHYRREGVRGRGRSRNNSNGKRNNNNNNRYNQEKKEKNSNSPKVEYKPYRIGDYLSLKKQDEALKKLGGLGPDLGNDELRKKRDQYRKRLEYSKNVTVLNRQKNNSGSFESTSSYEYRKTPRYPTPPKRGKENSSTKRAREFSEQIRLKNKIMKQKKQKRVIKKKEQKKSDLKKREEEGELENEDDDLENDNIGELTEIEKLELQNEQDTEWIMQQFNKT